MDIPTTSQIIKKYNLAAKKSLGQNFILDSNLTDKIARGAGNLDSCVIVEIGPGPGGLTKSILKLNPKKLIVIERDIRCIEALKEIQSFYPDKLEIIQGDALEMDLKGLNIDGKYKIIANLPYNIGTQLLFKWLENYQDIELMVLMFQKEVVERIVAKSNTKAFGRLSVMVNFFCETKKLFDISPSSFVPAPKVTSSLVMISPRDRPVRNVDRNYLQKVVTAAFSQRRKMIKSSLKSIFGINTQMSLEKCNINPKFRAEQLTLEQFGELSDLRASLD